MNKITILYIGSQLRKEYLNSGHSSFSSFCRANVEGFSGCDEREVLIAGSLYVFDEREERTLKFKSEEDLVKFTMKYL